jgi:hypothetical protein
MKMDTATFRELFAKSGGQLKKGRPVIDMSYMKQEKEPVNKHVRGATKVYDDQGNKLADSKWEHKCLIAIKESGLPYSLQQTFGLLDKRISKGMNKTLRKRTWTPDFVFEKHKIVADAKGWTTQIAKLKIHMFLDKYPDWDIYVLKDLNDLYNFIAMLKRME